MVWERSYDSDYTDFAFGIAVDGQSNAYVTGYMFEDEVFVDYLTIKYDKDGDFQWEKTFDGGYGEDWALDIAADETGNVYVTGYSEQSSSEDFYTIAYDTDGNVVWEHPYDSGEDEEANGIEVDDQGNIYVVGTTYPGSVGDFLILKYNSDGNLQWDEVYSEPGHEDWYEDAHDAAVDGNGNLYVTGYSHDQLHTRRILTLKYDTEGNLAWLRFYGEEYGYYSGDGITVDSVGNVYVVGSNSEIDSEEQHYFVMLKYDSNGDLVWDRSFERDSWPGYVKIAVDDSGDLYVIGSSYEPGNSDLFMTKYDPDGSVIWEITYDSGKHDFEAGIAVDASGYIYVAGSSGTISEMDFDYLAIKYDQSGAVRERPSADSSIILGVVENISATPRLRYALPQGTTGRLTFYSADGRAVGTYLLNSSQSTFTWDARNTRNTPSGVYFARLVVAHQSVTVKTILTR